MSPSPAHVKELKVTEHQGELWWLNVLGACLRVLYTSRSLKCMSPSPIHVKELEVTHHQGKLWWLNVLGACLRVPHTSRSLK
ncbi:hypothetical protein J6590_086776 [Homalodisca vitripennis]|nr:hypothetical protein J6590_086776 [Homalodisca vitripennis]